MHTGDTSALLLQWTCQGNPLLWGHNAFVDIMVGVVVKIIIGIIICCGIFAIIVGCDCGCDIVGVSPDGSREER